MNERIGNSKIYALAKEAGLIEFEQFAWNPELGSPTYESVAKARKFAELIVRECIDKIETYRIPVGNSAAGEMACEWTYDALKEIRDEIKENFGV